MFSGSASHQLWLPAFQKNTSIFTQMYEESEAKWCILNNYRNYVAPIRWLLVPRAHFECFT